jgi:predicted dienelactone hydrolase
MACLGLWGAWVASAVASVGMAELPANAQSGPVTVFYPTAAAPSAERRGTFVLDVAVDAPLAEGNRRLVVISHGSPASPWVHFDLARTLVNAGFVVALPEHFADNHKDSSEPGPRSWRRRPGEVSRAIDRLQAEARFDQALEFGRVGMFGMSAGGHTALTLAGGRWSPSRLRAHCAEHLAQDFHACAGPSVALTGGVLDGIKMSVVRTVIHSKLDDPNWYEHQEPRITAIVAGVPFAADFDPASLRSPRPALAIVSARQDRWLVPRFHSDAVLQACAPCEHLADLPNGGHGALLSPLPAERSEAFEALVGDPPGFDRHTVVPRLNAQIADFFQRQLLGRAK